MQGAFVMADMLKENRGLRTLVLDDNPIGQRGGRAILRALARMVELGTAGSRRIDLAHCNMNYTSSEPLFDPEHPGGHYTLRLDDPYERAVAWGLAELAWAEDGENYSAAPPLSL